MQFVYPFWLEPRPLSRWTLSEVDSTEYNNKIRTQMQRNATPSFINVEAGNGKRKKGGYLGTGRNNTDLYPHTGHHQRSNEVQIIIMINAPGAVVWHSSSTIAETSNEGGSLICEHRRHVHCSLMVRLLFAIFSRNGGIMIHDWIASQRQASTAHVSGESCTSLSIHPVAIQGVSNII